MPLLSAQRLDPVSFFLKSLLQGTSPSPCNLERDFVSVGHANLAAPKVRDQSTTSSGVSKSSTYLHISAVCLVHECSVTKPCLSLLQLHGL